MEDADEPDGLARLDAEGDDVLDLEVDRVADLDAVASSPSSTTSNGARSTPSISPTSGANPAIGPPFCPPKTAVSFSICSSSACSSTNMPRRQLPSVMTLGVSAIGDDLEATDVGALDLTLLDVEDEGDAAVVVGRAVVERHVARTHQVARARLDVAALQAPRHFRTPFLGGANDRFSAHSPRLSNLRPEREVRLSAAALRASRSGRPHPRGAQALRPESRMRPPAVE